MKSNTDYHGDMFKSFPFVKYFFNYLNIFSLIFGSIHFLISLFPTGDLDLIPYILIMLTFIITPVIYSCFNESVMSLPNLFRTGKEYIQFIAIPIIFLILVIFIVQGESTTSAGDWKTLDANLSSLNLSFNNDEFGLCCYYPSGGLFYGYLTSVFVPLISLKVNLIILVLFLNLNTYLFLKTITLIQNLNFPFFVVISILLPTFFVFFIQNAMVANLAGLTFAMYLASQKRIGFIHIISALIGSVAIHPTAFFYFFNLFLLRSALNSEIKMFTFAKRKLTSLRFYQLFIFFILFIVLGLLMMNYSNISNSSLKPLISHWNNYVLIDRTENGLNPNLLLLDNVLLSNFKFIYNDSLLILFFTYLTMAISFLILVHIKKFMLLLYFLATIAIVLILNTGQYWIVQTLKFVTLPFYGQSNRYMPILISQIYIFIFIFFSKLSTWFKSKYNT
jgi:hypothetical protein